MATRIPDRHALGIIRNGLHPDAPHRDAGGRTGAARIVTVTDDEVAAAIRAYWQDTHNLAEGAGAAPLAALLQERDAMRGRRVGVILCGGNIDLELVRTWVLEG
jgi:threonine dehydratase